MSGKVLLLMMLLGAMYLGAQAQLIGGEDIWHFWYTDLPEHSVLLYYY